MTWLSFPPLLLLLLLLLLASFTNRSLALFSPSADQPTLEDLCNKPRDSLHHLVVSLDSSRQHSWSGYCRVHGASNIILTGSSSSGSGQQQQQATLRCEGASPDNASSAIFSFLQVSNLTISNVRFVGCGASMEWEDLGHVSDTELIGPGQSTAVLCSHCSNMVLRNVTFTNGTGYSLVAINPQDDSLLDRVQVVGSSGRSRHFPLDDPACNVSGLEYVCNNRGLLLLFADSDLGMGAGRAHLTLNNSLFEKNWFATYRENASLDRQSFCAANAFQELIHPTNIEVLGPLPDVGAVTIVYMQTTFEASAEILNSVFTDNRGECFGAVFVLLHTYTANQAMQRIEGCTFVDNSPTVIPYGEGKNYFGSDVTVYMQYSGNYSEKDCVVIQDSFFKNYHATLMPDVTLVHFPDTAGKCTVRLSNLSTNTSAKFLFASGLTRSDTLELELEDIQMNGVTGSSREYKLKGLDQNDGLLTLVALSKVSLRGSSKERCYFDMLLGPVILTRSTDLFLTGEMLFANLYASNGASGAAIFLETTSGLWLQEPLAAEFCNNSAVSGGAIASTQLVSNFCIIQLLTLQFYTEANISQVDIGLNFTGNRAHVAGNSVYLQHMFNCSTRLSPHIRVSRPQLVYDSIFHFQDTVEDGLLEMSSNPTEICFCTGQEEDWGSGGSRPELDCAQDKLNVPVISTYPGRHFNVTVMSVDEIYQPVYTSMYNRLLPRSGYNSYYSDPDYPLELGRGQEIVKLKTYGYNCTQLRFNIMATTDNVSESLQTILTMYPYGEVNCLAQPVVVHECPPGFALRGGECRCSSLLADHGFRCDIDSLNVSRPDRGSWVGVVATWEEDWNETAATSWAGEDWNGGGNRSSEFVMGISNNCPFIYCSEVGEVNAEDYSALCLGGRTGILCGQCPENTSMTIGHPESCHRCSNLWLLTLPLYALVGVALVVLLFLLRLTVATGTVNGLIFYANIFNFNLLHFTSDRSTIWLSVFLSFLNLRLGFPVCFSEGLTTLGSTYLGFVVPVYLWLIVLVLILLSRRFSLISRLTSRSAIPVLATIVHLSFFKLLSLSMSGLSLVTLKLQAGHHGSVTHQLVWYYDGSVRYLEGAHAGLFLLSLASFLLFIVPYTVFLTGIKFFSRFSFTNRVRPFVDAFCAPFKDRWRFWFGLRLLVLIVLYIGFAGLRNHPDVLSLFKTIVLTLYTLFQVAVMPYRSVFVNALDIFFLVDSVLLNIVALYNGGDSHVMRIASNIFMVPIFLAFCVIIAYHIHLVLGKERLGSFARLCWGRVRRRLGGGGEKGLIDSDSQDHHEDSRSTGGSGSKGGNSERSSLNTPHATYSALVVNNSHSVHHYNPGELREPLLDEDSDSDKPKV